MKETKLATTSHVVQHGRSGLEPDVNVPEQAPPVDSSGEKWRREQMSMSQLAEVVFMLSYILAQIQRQAGADATVAQISTLNDSLKRQQDAARSERTSGILNSVGRMSGSIVALAGLAPGCFSRSFDLASFGLSAGQYAGQSVGGVFDACASQQSATGRTTQAYAATEHEYGDLFGRGAGSYLDSAQQTISSGQQPAQRITDSSAQIGDMISRALAVR